MNDSNMNQENKKCNLWKKFDWKFWVIIITVGLSLYKTIILSDNHIKTISKQIEMLSKDFVDMKVLIGRIDERTEHLKK